MHDASGMAFPARFCKRFQYLALLWREECDVCAQLTTVPQRGILQQVEGELGKDVREPRGKEIAVIVTGIEECVIL